MAQQERMLRLRAIRPGEDVMVFRDIGESRAALDQLLAAARDGKLSRVVVLDRGHIGPNWAELEAVMDVLSLYGVKLVDV